MQTLIATYSPDDNKLRLTASARLDAETYERIKASGFKWAPKQGLFVAPMWTPQRADLLLELCGEIGDEDTTLAERAEERADRFADYSESRAAEANDARSRVDEMTQHIPLGQPILIGHHSEARARKDAERIATGMRRAVQLWETSEYWRRRAQGALRAAKYKELPAVRARRIKTIEADKRKQQRTVDESAQQMKLWRREGLTLEQAKLIAGFDRVYISENGARDSVWSLLNSGAYSVEQAQRAAIEAHERQTAWAQRWIAHYDLRLTYERAMLDEAGGTEADRTKPEKGGAVRCWCAPRGGWCYIKKVNKVSVTVEDNWRNGGANFTRTVPFDALDAVMTAAEVATARDAGRLTETPDARGFFLAAPNPAESESTGAVGSAPASPTKAEPQVAGESPAASFARLRDQLAQGIETVSAPQLFPTPVHLAQRMAQLAEIGPGQEVLEPSAGTGRLLTAILEAEAEAVVTAVEISPPLIAGLIKSFPKAAILGGDFLKLADSLGRFDKIILNPPYAPQAADVAHIKRAHALLKPGGRLVALCANGPRQNEQLRSLVDELGGSWEVLPPDTFHEAGTSVRTALLSLPAA